jgi:ankyrin repeat protein/beta-lactamase regulating signal transducer with metallopeptidase domain
MNSTLMSFASGLTDYLLYASIIAAVLITIAWSVIKLGKVKAPVYNHMIWLCTLFAVLVLPVVFLYAPKVAVPVLPAQPKTSIALTQRNNTYASSGLIEDRRLDIQPLGPSASALPPESHKKLTALISVKNILACLWSVGFLFMLVRFLIDWHRIKRIMRLAEPLPVELLPRDIFPTRLKLLLSAQIGGPLCLGIFRPVILLPKKMCSNGMSEDLMMVLGHELAHVERRDWLVNIFQRIIETVLFFHPLVWYASAQLSHEREILCDHHVISKGVSPTDYIELLTRVVEQGFEKNSLNAVALFEGRRLVSRIKTLLKTENKIQLKASRMALIASVMIISLFMVLGTIRLEAKSSENNKSIAPFQPQEESIADGSKRPYGDCAISGKVVSAETGEPVENAQVSLYYLGTSDCMYIKVASDGTFNFKDIPSGTYTLLTLPVKGFQRDYYNPEKNNNQEFTINADEKRSGIILRIEPAYSISGKVLNEGGQPVKNSHLIAVAYPKTDNKEIFEGVKESHGAPVAVDGSYLLDGMDGSPVYIVVYDQESDEKDQFLPTCYYPGTVSREKAKMIFFNNGKSVKDINIQLTHKGDFSLEGTVTDKDTGRPIPKTFIIVHYSDMFFGYQAVYTDEQGYYHIDSMSTGDFRIFLDAEPWGYVRTHKNFKIDGGSKTTRLDFALSPAAMISGKFVNENGDPFKLISKVYGWSQTLNTHIASRVTVTWSSSSDPINKYAVKDYNGEYNHNRFDNGEGNFILEDMVFPTPDTFIIQGVMPGMVSLTFNSINKTISAKQILYKGRNILGGVIETNPHDKIEGVSIVIGTANQSETESEKNYLKSSSYKNLIRASLDVEYDPLIDKGADVNSRDTAGKTILMHASAGVYAGIADVVKLLIDNGVDVTAKATINNVEYTALKIAKENGNTTVMQILEKAGAKEDAIPEKKEPTSDKDTKLIQAVENGDHKAVRAALVNGANVNAKDTRDGRTVLMAASVEGYTDIIRLLLDKGADVNAKWDWDIGGITALWMASLNGHADVVKLLLEKGADVNAKNSNGETALFIASRQGYVDIVKVFLDKGADVNVRNISGETSLHLASQHGHADVVKHLLDKGAEVNAKTTINNVEWTALKFAKKQGHTDVVQVLEKAGAKEEVSPDKKETTPDKDFKTESPKDKNEWLEIMKKRLATMNALYGPEFSELGITEEKINALADIKADQEMAFKDINNLVSNTNPFNEKEVESMQKQTEGQQDIYIKYIGKISNLLGEHAYYQYTKIEMKEMQIDFSSQFNEVLSGSEKLTNEQQRKWVDAMSKSFFNTTQEINSEMEKNKLDDINSRMAVLKNLQRGYIDGYVECAKTILSPSQLKQLESFMVPLKQKNEEAMDQKIKTWQKAEQQPSN